MKLTFVALHIGVALIFLPIVFDWEMNRWVYYGMMLIGVVFVSIAGYNAQAKAVGMGEPGEELLQKGWRWVKQRVLRMRVDPEPLPDPMVPAHESVTPKPRRSALSKAVMFAGVLVLLSPYQFFRDLGPFAKYGLLTLGSFLIFAARRNHPPRTPDDPPHGREMVEVWVAWLKSLWRSG